MNRLLFFLSNVAYLENGSFYRNDTLGVGSWKAMTSKLSEHIRKSFFSYPMSHILDMGRRIETERGWLAMVRKSFRNDPAFF